MQKQIILLFRKNKVNKTKGAIGSIEIVQGPYKTALVRLSRGTHNKSFIRLRSEQTLTR